MGIRLEPQPPSNAFKKLSGKSCSITPQKSKQKRGRRVKLKRIDFSDNLVFLQKRAAPHESETQKISEEPLQQPLNLLEYDLRSLDSADFSTSSTSRKRLKARTLAGSESKREMISKIEGVLYSGKTPEQIVDELREMCYSEKKEGESKQRPRSDEFSTQEESLVADSDLCNFEILTSSDFL